MIWWLALKSAWSRRLGLSFVVLSVAVSATLVLSVFQLRQDARHSFSQAVSGVDLMVGPRGSASEFLLYTVFQMGRPSRNLAASNLDALTEMPAVAWAVPLQLGDRYREAPVWGTTPAFFDVFRVQQQALRFTQGRAFEQPTAERRQAVFELVLGASVASRYQHRLGDQLVLTHGDGGELAARHEQTPFTVVGVLAPTGGPIDRAVLVSVQGFEAMHVGWGVMPMGPGTRMPSVQRELLAEMPLDALKPASYTAILVGLQDRSKVFQVRRQVENMTQEPLMAVLPGVTLDELWQVLSVAENAMLMIGLIVGVASLLSVAALVLAGLSARRKEFAILRAVGLSPGALMRLVSVETTLVCGVGLLVGLTIQQLALLTLSDFLRQTMGINVQVLDWPVEAWWTLGAMLLSAVLISLVPAWRAYRWSLADGLSAPQA
jgi:putative ABC transport system permease protein